MKKYPNIGRTLAILLVLAVLLPCISMTALSQDLPCAEDGCSGRYLGGICTKDAAHYEAAPLEDGVYKISNVGQLCWFAELVNSGASEYGGDNGDVYDAALTADITINADMEAEDKLHWTPIGLYTSATEYVRYSGTFDGKGYTIYGLYYDNTAYHGRNAGLFGILDSNGTVKNLTLADSYISGATEIGGIVGHNYGTVINCTQSGSVTGIGATGGIVCRNMGLIEKCVNTGAITGAATGGIAAENNGEVVGCANSGAISGTNSVGGIVGMNDGTVADSRNRVDVTGANTHVGGIVGNHVGGEIVGCGNSGSVTGASDYIGGVAGVCSGAEITKSFNGGNVTGADASDAVGGVVGAIDGTNTEKSVIASCYNTGAVNGRGWVGGIAGVSGYQKTPQTVELSNSYNTGTVTGTSHVGAVVGKLNKGTVSDTYFLLGSAISGATQATAEQFASGEIAYKLNGSTSEGNLIWKQLIGTDTSPKFEGAVVYYDSEKGIYYNDVCSHVPTEAVRENEVAATCTEDGSYDSVVYCDLCNEEISRERVTVPALGHDYVNGECSRCDAAADATFTDVPVGSFYFDPVEWAVDEGITTGATPTTFNPNGDLQRAQFVTMLWRHAGQPEPTTTVNPFTDVKASDFFYKAVLWAVEENITTGTSASTFSPYGITNRAQAVTFLWRYLDEPEATGTNSFTDVVAGAWYEGAINWAVGAGVTNGMGDGTFGIGNPCNRAHAVTFLYRALA